MDGISSASAVIAVLQLGFSLATTLNSYLASVRHGRDDIANLANEIDATIIHVQELDKLIQENDKTGGWNENGLKIARKCCMDCETVLNSLRRTLSKSGAEISTSEVVKRDEINLSLFDRLTWPWLKPRLAASKQELQAVKIDILIALNTYKANVGTPPSEKEAAAERIIPLWKSKNALEQQLITTRKIFTATGPPPMAPRVVVNSPTRSRSRSRIRSRERVRPQARESSSDSSSPSPEGRRGRRRHSSSTESVRREFPPPGADRNGETDSVPSRSPSPDSDDGGNIEKGRRRRPKLTGDEVDSPREEKGGIVKQIFKSFMQSRKSQSDVIGDLIQAYPAEAKKLGLSPKTTQNTKDTIPLLLQDSTLKGGRACFRAMSLIKINDKEFRPYQIDYPFAMLAKQLHHEQKTQKPGEVFSLRAWQNFPTLPPWCKEYIEEFLARGNKMDHFWTLLIADPIYNKAHDSWRANLFGKGKSRKEKDLTSVLVVFKHCAKETIRRETGPENTFDSLAEKLGGPLEKFVATVSDRLDGKRRERKRDERSRTRSRRRVGDYARRRGRSRSRSRYRARGSIAATDAGLAGAAAAAVGAAAYDARRRRRRRRRRDDVEDGMVSYGSEPVYTKQNGAAPVYTEQSSGIEVVDLDETEEELMKKIMVQYTGLPPSYSEGDVNGNSINGNGDRSPPPDFERGFVEDVEDVGNEKGL